MRYKERIFRTLAFLLVFLNVMSPAAETGLAFAAWLEPPAAAPGKDEVGVDDNDDLTNVTRKANVLFFIDTGYSMMFEPRGRIPRVYESSKGVIGTPPSGSGYDKKETAIDLMQYATFGDGTVPAMDSFFTAWVTRNVNYGRETNLNNNLQGLDLNSKNNRERYYSPYDRAGHGLREVFQHQSDAYTGAAATGGLGYDFKGTDAISEDRALPYMLVFKNPEYWEHGKKSNVVSADLVPNDSRLYQTKLVMWRLMEDQTLFRNIRFGMAQVYSNAEPIDATLNSDDPGGKYDGKNYKDRLRPLDNASKPVYKIPNWDSTSTYKYGAFYINQSGDVYPRGADSIEDGQDVSWSVADGAISSNGKDNYARRAILHVPIAEFNTRWTTIGKKVTMTHMERFKQWFDGVEDIAGLLSTGANEKARSHDLNANQFDIHRNPELKVSNGLPLSRAIFPNTVSNASGGNDMVIKNTTTLNTDPNRDWYFAYRGVAYAKKDKIFYDKLSNSDKAKHGMDNGKYILNNSDQYNFYFKPGSGQAVGSVLDFFSPDYVKFGPGSGIKSGKESEREIEENWKGMEDLGYTNTSTSAGRDSESFADLIDEQFPIGDECDRNYVVLLTGGDNGSIDTYSLAEAVGNLYDQSAKRDSITRMYYENGKRKFKKVTLRYPIKTIVVGFIDPKDQSKQALELKTKLNAAARRGVGLRTTNDSVNAYFANDVPGLLNVMRDIMGEINSEIEQPARESMLAELEDTSGGAADGVERMDIYAASYRANLLDQWEGTLTKYTREENKSTGVITTQTKGELGGNIMPGNLRTLKYWNGGAGNNFEVVEFSGPSYSNNTSIPNLAKLTGLDFDVSKTTELDTSFMGVGKTFTGKLHPSRAMFDWYYGYDVSYLKQTYYERDFMLADQGRSGIVKAGRPAAVNSLPGFKNFAEDHQGDSVRLYIQTNDGVLHAVDPETMSEKLAILPPPTLLPRRIFNLKTTKENGQYRWIDADTQLKGSSDGTSIRSVPSYILDGPLQLRYFDMDTNPAPDTHNWKGLLFGSLGRGGSGLYVMDVTEADKPRFNWYRETIESDDRYLRHIWRAQNTSPPSGAVHDAEPNVATIDRNAGNYWTGLYDNPDDHPYEQLGFNPPKPYFSVARMGSNGQTTYTYQNLVALAGGMQNKLDLTNNGTMGAALYLADPDASSHTGQKSGCVRVFNSGSLRAVSDEWRIGSEERGDDPYMGMVNSEPVFLATRRSSYEARGVFFSDNRGGIFYVTFEDPETNTLYASSDDWRIYTVASLRGAPLRAGDVHDDKDPTAGYSIPWGLVAGGSSGRLYVSGGTANAVRADPPNEGNQHLLNKSQMIFAFAMPDIAAEGGKKSERDDWAQLDAESDSDDVLSEKEKEKRENNGWYIPLRGPNDSYFEEYVTTRPVLSGGNLYVATFMQKKNNITSSEPCETGGSLMGKSRLYVISLETGSSALSDSDKKYHELDGVKIVNVMEIGDKIALRAAELDADAAKKNKIPITHMGEEGGMGVDLMSLEKDLLNDEDDDEDEERSDNGGSVTHNDTIINYWLYK